MFKNKATPILLSALLLMLAVGVLKTIDSGVFVKKQSPIPAEWVQEQTRTEDKTEQLAGTQTSTSSEIAHIQNLLDSNNFAKAVSTLDALYSRLNSDDLDTIKNQFLSRARFLMAADQNQAATNMLLVYTASNDDIDAWNHLVDSAAAVPNWQLATQAALRVTALEHRPQELLAGLERLVRVSSYLRSELERAQDSIGIQQLYQRLYDHHPGYPRFQLELARAQISAGEIDHARPILDTLQYDPDFGTLAGQMLEAISPSDKSEPRLESAPRQGEIVVPLIRDGDSFLLDVRVNSKRMRLLLDTGASITALSQKAISQLGLRPTNLYINLNTANGQRRSRLYEADRITIGGLHKNNVVVAEVEFSNSSDIQGLLGTDLLNQINEQYSYLLDNQNNTLRFRLK